jgi:predicted HTH transcriptional regulator
MEQLSLGCSMAEFWENPELAVKQLLASLKKYYPLDDVRQPENQGLPSDIQFFDKTTNIFEFDREGLQRFRSQLRDNIKKQYPPDWTAEIFLTKSYLMQNDRLTNAGLLLFGVNPFERFHSSIVNCIVYHGDTLSASREHERIPGNVPNQIIKTRDFIASHIDKVEMPTIDSSFAKTLYSYPMICVREIIANALVHRDYEDDRRKVHVRLFSDRLEIASPGKWQARDLPDNEPKTC